MPTLPSVLAALDDADPAPPAGMLALFGAVGLGLWVLAAYQLLQARRGVLVDAEVTGFTTYVDRGQTMYSARLKAVVDGREVHGTSAVAKSWESPPVGTVVRARYRAEDPEAPLVDGGPGQYVLPAALFLVGAGCLAFASQVLR